MFLFDPICKVCHRCLGLSRIFRPASATRLSDPHNTGLSDHPVLRFSVFVFVTPSPHSVPVAYHPNHRHSLSTEVTRNLPKRLVLPLDGLLVRVLVLCNFVLAVLQGVVCYISENQKKKIEKKQKECKRENSIKKKVKEKSYIKWRNSEA